MTGIYDLVAVLTHKGRSADSGHYVAWVKQESGQSFRMNSFFFINYYAKQTIINDLQLATGKWIEYDDDNPIAQREEDILKLSGGGRAHMGTNSCFSILNFHSPNRNSLEMDPLLTTNNVSF